MKEREGKREMGNRVKEKKERKEKKQKGETDNRGEQMGESRRGK